MRNGKIVLRVTSPVPIHDKPARENLWFIAADSQHPPRPLPLDTLAPVEGEWHDFKASHLGSGLALVGDERTWEDYDVSVTLAPYPDQAGVVGRALKDSHYQFTAACKGEDLHWQIARSNAGKLTILDQGNIRQKPSEPLRLRLSCVGEHLIGYINDNLVSSNVYDYTLPLGRAGLIAEGPAPADFTNFQVVTCDPDLQSSK
jgi:hypothetical protein